MAGGDFGVPPFHDFAGSVGARRRWLDRLPAVLLLKRGVGAIKRTVASPAHPPSSIPFLALGARILTVGWFGFNVMSAQRMERSMAGRLEFADGHGGGTPGGSAAGRNDPGFCAHGPWRGWWP